MPGKQRKALDEKKYFIEEWKLQEVSPAEVCRRFEISRQTGYKWLERYEQEGEAGLEEHSRAPLHHPQGMPTDVRNAVVNMRRQHPNWGPRKLRACLQRDTPKVVCPAACSIGKEHGPGCPPTSRKI